ncbi:excalibur calcium-binding domain-containing protein [Streptomyces sp. APSN-46.1]|uniref:excalibur calcium-binding domain-containing protein n=1 Tax=Streptomyces sp. APSN-46.1 TaxID=2929049 RepID=UPI001FB4E0AD|nr:excalibur calcium-binding domain-containing protein [Streptomyces sp. APSN-46.1]MCJ1677181.1 excalibur calcium-binding domain-containing protein [Streptomyces sp. APSN-46.1]
MYPPPHPYPPAPARRWWQHPALVIAALIILPPVGIALAWTSQWSKGKKIVATVLAGLWFLAPFMTDPPKKTEADAKPKAAATPTATATPTPSASASPVNTVPPPLTMPHMVGDTVESMPSVVSARHTVKVHSVYSDDTPPSQAADQQVCFQSVAVNTPLPEGSTIDLYVITKGGTCPAQYGQPKPMPKPTEKPKPAPAPTEDDSSSSSTSTGGGSSIGGSSSTGGGGSAYYKNCAAARAAGAAPVHRGDPGYGRHLDRDGDGVGCE